MLIKHETLRNVDVRIDIESLNCSELCYVIHLYNISCFLSYSIFGNAVVINIRGCIQTFPDWPLGTRTANGKALCHQMQLYHYLVSHSSEFCYHNPLCCFSPSVYYYCCLVRYRLSPETSGYTLVYRSFLQNMYIYLYSVSVQLLKSIA
jgi:hypothetical protein